MGWEEQHLEAMRQQAAEDAARQAQADETARLMQAQELNRIQSAALETKREEAHRQVNAQAYCNSHGIPISVQGACPMCLSEAKAQEHTAATNWGPEYTPATDVSDSWSAEPHQETRRERPSHGLGEDLNRETWTASCSEIALSAPSAESTRLLRPRDRVGAEDMRLFREEAPTSQPLRREHPGREGQTERPDQPAQPLRPREEKHERHRPPEEAHVYYCTNCSMPNSSPGICPSCGAILREATVSELANLGAERFIGDPSRCVDTRRFGDIASVTALGYPREAGLFFTVLLDEHPELFSPKNRERIERDEPPEVDKTWVKHHPEQIFYLKDRLVHHHWDQGPWAFAIPQHFHQQFHRDLHPLRYPDKDR